MPTSPRIRPFSVVVIHPDPLTRSTLTDTLSRQPRIERCHVHADLPQAEAWARTSPPGDAEVAMVHLDGGRADTWRAAQRLTIIRRGIRVVALSAAPTKAECDRAAAEGFHGYVDDDMSLTEYVEMAARVVGGETVRPAGLPDDPYSAPRVVLALPLYQALVDGRLPADVGHNERNARRIRRDVRERLGVSSDSAVVALLIGRGLIDPPASSARTLQK